MWLSLFIQVIEYDYDDIVYPIPFSELYRNKSSRYINFGRPISGLPIGVLTGEVPAYHEQTSDILMMTGASDNHGLSSFNCLYSMILGDPYASYAYADFGLSEKKLSMLFAHFESILQIQKKMKSTGIIAYRKFNWKHFPDWYSLSSNSRQRGGLSFKVVTYMDVFNEWKGVFYWLDAGDIINEGISREVTMARHYGLYSPYSLADVSQWVHNDSQQFMLDNGMLYKRVPGSVKMISSGVLVMNYFNATIRNRFSPIYHQCAFTQKCISPRSSDMFNHRQDQAIVTLLIGDLHIPYSGWLDYRYCPIIHADTDNDEYRAKATLSDILLKIQHTFSIGFNNSYIDTHHLEYSLISFGETSRKRDEMWIQQITRRKSSGGDGVP